MTDVSVNGGASTGLDDLGGTTSEDDQNVELLGAASVGLGVLGFFTLLRLADRRDRSPFRALMLFFATTAESTGATVLGTLVISKSRRGAASSQGFLLGATGTVLGILTTALNLNWMRTRRRI